jgi:ankyrin repeat protein
VAILAAEHQRRRAIEQREVDVGAKTNQAAIAPIHDMSLSGKDVTALMLACGNGFHEIARLLLQNGVSPNTADANGWSPIHWAAGRKHLMCLAHRAAAAHLRS